MTHRGVVVKTIGVSAPGARRLPLIESDGNDPSRMDASARRAATYGWHRTRRPPR